MPRLLAALCLLLIALAAQAIAAEPSFDCGTARTAREMATCRDGRLAALDREMAAAWQPAIAHAKADLARALREDQRKSVSNLDGGFEIEVWGKQGAPDDKRQMLKDLAQLRRSSGDGNDPLSGLENALRERITFLRSLSPASSFAGLWKNNDAELWIEPAGDGTFKVMFGLANFGFAKYQCHFTASFTASTEGQGEPVLLATVAHNTNVEYDQDIRDNLRIRHVGETVTLDDDVPHQGSKTDPYYVCPRVPSLTGPLFHTGLKPADAFHLDPGKD